MRFRDALKRALAAHSNQIHKSDRDAIERVLQMHDSKRKECKLKRMERAVRDQLVTEGVLLAGAEVDWRMLDWSKMVSIAVRVLSTIIPLIMED